MSSTGILSFAALACVLAASISSSQLVGPLGNRIFGGKPAVQGEIPFIAALEVLLDGNWGFHCGGSVIDQRHILTAAHCVMNGGRANSPGKVRVKLGCHKLSECEGPIKLKKIIIHPDYRGCNNDVAILVLDHDIEFTQAGSNPIGKIRLARQQQDDGSWGNLTVAGWGSLKPFPPQYPDALQEVQVVAVPFAKCKKTYTLAGSDEMCAGSLDAYSCRDDSGGPLFKRMHDGTHLQVGVVSRGDLCSVSDVGGLYARVATFYSWIVGCTSDNECESI